ncbi:hypothetical protein A4X13_0g8087 [Tilletia indica]|uniref:Uncharacterized protein n=1 Tax=Tilletia indica TaxID=43049 RepID=A0A177T2X3_9BASI|nr:hypothetical protein A4X13_0g8087 [Tilletia indica]
MGLIIVLLRWTHLLLSLRAAHKAISHGRRPEARQPAYPNGRMNNPNARRARPARRKEQDRADVLRFILTRFFVWMLYRRAEGILDGLGQWILFYDTAKTLFLFWLLVSHDFAASQLFHSVLEPLVHPYEPLLDAVATRVFRSLHGLNFLSLLFFTHLSQRIPPTLSQGTKSAFERIRTSIVWLETKLAERRAQAIEVHELDDSVDGRSGSGSPPPFFVPLSRAASNNPYATLPGSWRPLHSPAIPSRPGLPDTWGTGASSSRSGPSSLPTRRVVSTGNGNGIGNEDMPSSSRIRTNGRAHATYSARALSKLPQPPTNEPSQSVPRVRLMPDWPASPHASSSNLAASTDSHAAGLGQPPSPPVQLARSYGLSSSSGLNAQQGSTLEPTKKTSSSPKTTPRKRKKRESLDEDGYLEEEEPAKKPRGKGSATSKARSPKRASKSGASARTVKSNIPVTVKGKQRQRVVEIQDEDDDDNSGGSSEVVEPAPKRTRIKTKGKEKEKEEVIELPPSYSTRTLRARPNRDSSSTTPSIASPPPTTATTEARTTTTTTTVKMASKKRQGKPASPAKIDGEKNRKKMSSTSTGARTRGSGRVDGPGVSAAAVMDVNEKSSSSGSRGTVRLSRRA